MRNGMLALCFAGTIVAAGSVGEYLGFEVGKVEAGARFRRDSIHFLFPVPSDTIMTTSWTDTSTVIAETVYQTYPAWLFRNVTTLAGPTETIDTAYESGDTLLRSQVSQLGFSLWIDRYLVPFQVGSWWRTGIAGTYYLDLNGDSLVDTLTVWADTSKVVGIDTVVVPFDTIPDCYQILTTLRQALSMTYEAIPVRETSYARTFEWYKDSLGWVKDSTWLDARMYMQIVIWIHVADAASMMLGELTDLYVGIEHPSPAQPTEALLQARPNPFSSHTTVLVPGPHRTQVRVYDATGRCVRRLEHHGSVVWNGKNQTGQKLPPGVYYLKAGQLCCPVTKTE